MIERSRVISLISSAAGLLLAVGSMTVFAACRPKDDGTMLNCHNAQIGVALCGVGIAALFAIAAFVRNKAAVLICDAAVLALSVITFLIPGVLVHICLLSNMYCQSRLKPFARGLAIIIALLALWDILCILKEIKEGRS